MRPAVRLMDRLMKEPLSTPAQLRMLEDGLFGDPEPARRVLGLEGRSFTAEAAGALGESTGPLFGASLRLRPDPPRTDEERRVDDGARSSFGAALAVATLAVALPPLLGPWISGVWWRLAAVAALTVPAAMLAVRLPWTALFRPSAPRVGLGIAAAVVLYGLGAVVSRLLLTVPGAAAQVSALYAWKDALAPGWAAVLLPFIIGAEEVVWRTAVTLPLAARLGPVRGILAASAGFALAHVSLGVPLLLVAALGAGAFWSALVVRTRSAVAAVVSHLVWDVVVLYVWPYA
jgi:hypothetical protein